MTPAAVCALGTTEPLNWLGDVTELKLGSRPDLEGLITGIWPPGTFGNLILDTIASIQTQIHRDGQFLVLLSFLGSGRREDAKFPVWEGCGHGHGQVAGGGHETKYKPGK